MDVLYQKPILSCLVQKLDIQTYLNLKLTCKHMNSALSSEKLWNGICQKGQEHYFHDIVNTNRYIVVFSHGICSTYEMYMYRIFTTYHMALLCLKELFEIYKHSISTDYGESGQAKLHFKDDEYYLSIVSNTNDEMELNYAYYSNVSGRLCYDEYVLKKLCVRYKPHYSVKAVILFSDGGEYSDYDVKIINVFENVDAVLKYIRNNHTINENNDICSEDYRRLYLRETSTSLDVGDLSDIPEYTTYCFKKQTEHSWNMYIRKHFSIFENEDVQICEWNWIFFKTIFINS